jgi:ketopantoate reductase
MPLRVTFVGCGALGGVYAALLARAGAQVFALTRAEEGTRAISLERRHPTPITAFSGTVTNCRMIPADSDVLVLAVRLEQLDGLYSSLRSVADKPLVSLTPLFPSELERLTSALGTEPICAMPAIAGYFAHGTLRYFVPPMTPTLIDATGKHHAAVRELTQLFNDAKLPARFRAEVAERNHATTVAFFPVSLALSTAGSVERLAARSDLLELASRATTETRKLAQKLGRMDFGVAMLTALVSPTRLRWACRKGLVRDAAFIEFLDQHFAQKLRSQHLILAREISSLASDHGIDAAAFRSLFACFVKETRITDS